MYGNKKCNNCNVKKCKGMFNSTEICNKHEVDKGLMHRPFNCYKIRTIK